MFTVESYTNLLKDNLSAYSKKLIDIIKEIRTYNYEPTIDLLDFTLFQEPFTLSIRMFSMDKDANEVFQQNKKYFSGSKEILENVKYFNVSDHLIDDFWDFYDQNEEDLQKIEKEIIKDWFLHSWKKAYGQKIKLVSYLYFHDDLKSFDLHREEWISDEKKWDI